LIDPPACGQHDPQPNPGNPDAIDLHFELLESPDPPPKAQRELKQGICKAIRTCQQLYLEASPPQPDRFRMYFIRLFRIAQIGLQGQHALPGPALAELAFLFSELKRSPDQDRSGQPGYASEQDVGTGCGATASPAPKGAYAIWVADASGKPIGLPVDDDPEVPNPASPEAVEIFFGFLDSPEPPPKEQFALHIEIEKVLRACRRLYLERLPQQPAKFRIYFTRLFRMAQLGLEGRYPLPEVAASGLADIASDLIDDEGPAIKNGYLVKLGKYACFYSAPLLILFLFLHLLPDSVLRPWVEHLEIDAHLLSCFLLLWVGCFAGVWLSYGIRKTKFSLIDLTRSDDDRLAPHIRLLFAGLLTMLIGILFTLGLVKLSIGSVSLTDIASSPLLAFIVGTFCGISELALPVSISNRATTFMQNVK
jgi:hypothetical protein